MFQGAFTRRHRRLQDSTARWQQRVEASSRISRQLKLIINIVDMLLFGVFLIKVNNLAIIRSVDENELFRPEC